MYEQTSGIRSFLEAAPDAMVVVADDGHITIANTQAERVFGFGHGELVGLSVEELVPDRYRARHAGHRAAFVATPGVRPMAAGLELFARRKDGTEFPAEISLAPIEVAGSRHVTAAVRDVTSRKRTEAKFRALVESAPDGMVIVDRAGRIALVNGQTETLFQHKRDDLIGRPVEILIPEGLARRHVEQRDAFLAAPRVRGMGTGRELYGRRRDGSEFPVEISLSPLETEDGLLVSAAIRDVSERRRAEEARMHLAAIVRSSQDAIIGQTLDGTVTSWNDAAERLFGYRHDEIVGRPMSLLLPPSRAHEDDDVLARIMRGEAVPPLDTERLHRNGTLIAVSITTSAIQNAQGDVVGVSRIAHDVSARLRNEQALRRAKDAAEAAVMDLESFSYSVAHDLRAPLRSMDGFSQAILEDYADKVDDEGRRYLTHIRRSAQQMAQLIDDLLRLSRVTRAEFHRERVDLSTLASTIADRLDTAAHGRRVHWTIAARLVVTGDAALLAVLLDNLLGNAWKFTAHRALAHIELGTTVVDGQTAYVVRDDGAGFDMAYAGKLFGVFQRLHAATEFEGTGIGLATARRIVRRHGGRIWADGAVDQGATFFFTLDEIGGGV